MELCDIASVQFENVAASPSQVSESPLPPLKSVSVSVPFRNRAQKHSPTTCALPHWTSLPQDHGGGPAAEGALLETTLECLPPLGGGWGAPCSPEKDRTAPISVFSTGLDSCLSAERAAITNVNMIVRRK